MFDELGRRMDEHSEKFKKDLENIQKRQTELKNTMTAIKKKQSTLDYMIQRKGSANWKTEQWRSLKLNRKREKDFKKNEDMLRDLWDNIKCTNILIIGVPKREERKKGVENLFGDIISENFPNLGKETDIQVQEAQRIPNKINPKRSTPRYIRIKMAKITDKERLLKATR